MGAESFRRKAEEVLQARVRTVWDARRLLRAVIGQVVPLVFDDGQHAESRRWGVLLDVIHSPDLGFALKIKGLLPVADGETRRDPRWRSLRRRISVIPAGQLRSPVDDRLRFLLQDPEAWPLPEPWTPCSECGTSVSGRFCDRCGVKVRSVHHLGAGYSAEQVLLRGRGGRACAAECGGMVAPWSAHCGKCGTRAPIGEGPAERV